MENPVYTKEMKKNGELPEVGMRFLMGELGTDGFAGSRHIDFVGLECKVSCVFDHGGFTAVAFFNGLRGFGCLLGYKQWMLPLPTIEDELFDITSRFIGREMTQADLVCELLDKYNITPKDK